MTYAAIVVSTPVFGLVEHAIETFERLHSVEVTVHDLKGNISPFLRPDRFHHRSAYCLAVKAEGRTDACLSFELTRTRHDLASRPEGRIHICHAGLVEWVVPVFLGDKLNWVLFAGQRLPGPNLKSAERFPQIPWPKSPWGKAQHQLARIDEAQAQLILEHLRQLAARLRYWAVELNPNRARPNTTDTAPDVIITRQVAILRFVEDHYAEPVTLEMLARKLCLSESRTSHVVQQSCSMSFRELLVQKRLRVAMDLLLQSGMSVLEVALASGFEDVAHFHRLFRRRVKLTPGQFRLKGGT
jgi:AraC-like DNA-binding protein